MEYGKNNIINCKYIFNWSFIFGHVEEESKTRQEAKVKNNKIAMYVEMGPGTGV